MLAMASEYLRRNKVGENIIQPDFRFGDNGMKPVHEEVNKMMPMETGSRKNLIAASEGRIPHDLNREKVRGLAEALLGDADAMVFDRHWAEFIRKRS